MNKTALVNYIANKTGLTKKDVNSALDAMTEAVIETVANKDSVTLTGFGTFLSVHRKKTRKRNPKTGDPVDVPAKDVAKFKPGKGFREALL